MRKSMVGALALLTAMAFSGGTLAISGETTSSRHHAQSPMTPDTAMKSEDGKEASAKTKKAKRSKKANKTNKASQSRKSTQPVN